MPKDFPFLSSFEGSHPGPGFKSALGGFWGSVFAHISHPIRIKDMLLMAREVPFQILVSNGAIVGIRLVSPEIKWYTGDLVHGPTSAAVDLTYIK